MSENEGPDEVVNPLMDEVEPPPIEDVDLERFQEQLEGLGVTLPAQTPSPQDLLDMRRANRKALRELGFDFNKTYYLSGPMSGYEDFNYPYFTFVSMALRGAGLDLESPHENQWPEGHEDMKPKKFWKHIMEACALQMEKCEGIIMLKGWPQSNGARSELKDALSKNWPVWFFTDDNNMINMNKQIPQAGDDLNGAQETED